MPQIIFPPGRSERYIFIYIYIYIWKITQHVGPNIVGTEGLRNHPRYGTQCVMEDQRETQHNTSNKITHMYAASHAHVRYITLTSCTLHHTHNMYATSHSQHVRCITLIQHCNSTPHDPLSQKSNNTLVDKIIIEVINKLKYVVSLIF